LNISYHTEKVWFSTGKSVILNKSTQPVLWRDIFENKEMISSKFVLQVGLDRLQGRARTGLSFGLGPQAWVFGWTWVLG
jgi:hypothetical protein